MSTDTTIDTAELAAMIQANTEAIAALRRQLEQVVAELRRPQ